ncbi:hypothetical protein [Psychrobacillus sp. FSL K6-1267]|uniref:hypothetical protein n=1 Tax=Psychrobacillus sp. FSL K6-1267 TaxID=2921543 RepID=UPI0030F8FB5D
MYKRLKRLITSDVKLIKDTCWYDSVEKIDGFKFYTKRPFSNSYQWHAVIGLEYTYEILSLIQDGIKNKRKAILIEIQSGWGRERVYIWRGSFKKAEKQIFEMIKELQQQY